MVLSAGSRLGPYEIEAAIGAGGMGEVYRARDTRLDRNVAIKVLPPGAADDPGRRARIEREAKAIAALNDPHICTLYDVGDHDGSTFLVMELLQAKRSPPGSTGADAPRAGAGRGHRHRRRPGHRPPARRDPPRPQAGNVMLTASSAARQGSPQAKLLDFGLARLTHDAEGAVVGESRLGVHARRAAHAPGHDRGHAAVHGPGAVGGAGRRRADGPVALGAILYEMVTGRRAFEGKSDAGLVAAILDHEPAPIASLQPHAPPAARATGAAVPGEVARCPPGHGARRGHQLALDNASRPAPGARRPSAVRRLTLRPVFVLAAVLLWRSPSSSG